MIGSGAVAGREEERLSLCVDCLQLLLEDVRRFWERMSRTQRQLTAVDLLDYNTRMARPKKFGHLRLDTDLRIPVTREQKALIAEATQDEPEGMAAWARAVLLRAAQGKLARPKVKKAKEE